MPYVLIPSSEFTVKHLNYSNSDATSVRAVNIPEKFLMFFTKGVQYKVIEFDAANALACQAFENYLWLTLDEARALISGQESYAEV